MLADGSQTIYIADATNSNRKLFKITAVNNTLKTVTVDVAPTGTISNSAWGIGGQLVFDSAVIESSLAAGWTLQFNDSPASKSGTFFTARASGNATDGLVRVIGKTGVRPVLTVTGANNVIVTGGGLGGWHFENLEFVQQAASGDVCNAGSSSAITFLNCKISDGGGHGFLTSQGGRVIMCEVTGIGGDGILVDRGLAFGNNVHDIGGSGIRINSNSGGQIINNTIDTCAGRGIYLAATPNNLDALFSVIGNTVYGCGDSGLQVDDADTQVALYNNIFSENGNAAGEYNVEWVAGDAQKLSHHGYNLLYHPGTGGAANALNFTPNSTEPTSDPQFTDAPNGNFSLGSSSPAKAAGYPGQLLGGSLGYMDIGAVQREEPTGGGGGSGGAHIIGGTVVR